MRFRTAMGELPHLILFIPAKYGALYGPFYSLLAETGREKPQSHLLELKPMFSDAFLPESRSSMSENRGVAGGPCCSALLERFTVTAL